MKEGLTRREFLKSVAATPFILTGSEEEVSTLEIKEIEKIPGMNIQVHPWCPENIADKVNSQIRALTNGKYSTRFEKKPSDFPHLIYGGSQKGRWTLELLVRASENPKLVFCPEDFLDYRTQLLFDNERNRIYALQKGDAKKLEVPVNMLRRDIDYFIAQPCDNGAVKYVLEKIGDDSFNIRVIADIKNKQKIFIRSKEVEPWHAYVAQKGNRGVIVASDRFYIFEMKSGGVVFEGRGAFGTTNADGSVIMYGTDSSEISNATSYHRIDLTTRRDKLIWKNDAKRSCFVLSPDGDYCICSAESGEKDMFRFPKNRFDFYIHSTQAGGQIDWVKRVEFPIGVNNKGEVSSNYSEINCIIQKSYSRNSNRSRC